MAKGKQKQEDKVETRFRQPPFRPTFIKQWRKKKGWSQGKLADAVDLSTATISQIENGKTGYTQANLEAIAWALDCDVVDLLIRNPTDPEGIWGLWDTAKPAQRKQIIGIIRAVLSSEVA